jgi:hypothetical protein
MTALYEFGGQAACEDIKGGSILPFANFNTSAVNTLTTTTIKHGITLSKSPFKPASEATLFPSYAVLLCHILYHCSRHRQPQFRSHSFSNITVRYSICGLSKCLRPPRLSALNSSLLLTPAHIFYPLDNFILGDPVSQQRRRQIVYTSAEALHNRTLDMLTALRLMTLLICNFIQEIFIFHATVASGHTLSYRRLAASW